MLKNWLDNILKREQSDAEIIAYYIGIFETTSGYSVYDNEVDVQKTKRLLAQNAQNSKPALGELERNGKPMANAEYKNYFVLAIRNPIQMLRPPSVPSSRSATRQIDGGLYHEPPRITWLKPYSGPVGFF
jgi:hypothetical protein